MINLPDLTKKMRGRPEVWRGIAKQKWLRIIGLTAIELIMVTVLALPFLETTQAHALPANLDSNLQVTGSAPAAILALQGSTSLTVSIESAPWAARDSNGNPGVPDGEIPTVMVVAVAITNTGAAAATNVTIDLDYNPTGGWVFLSGEVPTRTLSTLGAGDAYHAYWFVQYPQTNGATHQYTINASASNASLVSASKTTQVINTIGSGNQGLAQTNINVSVGVAFTMTQVYTLGTNPLTVALQPVGNDDFDVSAYRLLAVDGRILDGVGTQLSTFTDEVYLSSLPANSASVEVTYTFLALLPSNTRVCSYAGVEFQSNRKYDQNYCSNSLNTVVDINGGVSLELNKQVNLANVRQSQILQYTITYTNTDLNRDISFVWFWDDLPPNVSLITATINPASDPNETTATQVAWNIGTVPTNTTGTLSFSVLVDGNGQDIPNGTALTNQVNFGINPGSTIPLNEALTSTVTSIVRAPTITVSKTDGEVTANPGDLLTYVIQITNSGSVPAVSVVVTDVLPANVSRNGPTTPPFDTENGQTLVWNSLGPIGAPGGTLAITIPVQIDPNLAQDGTLLTNVGTVSYQNTPGHIYDNEIVMDATTVDVPTSTLSLSKTADDLNGPPLVVGDTIRYTLQVTNTGAFTAFNVTVTDDLPDEVTCQSVTGGPGACADPLIWNVGNLGPQDTATLLIDVTINFGADGVSIINSGSVTSTNATDPNPDPEVCPDGSPPNGSNCDETPGPDTTLDLSKTSEDADGPPLVVGDTLTYTLQVTNTGTFTANNVIVTDDLPDEVTCQSVSGGLTCADPLIWNVGNLAPLGAPGDTATLLIEVTINPGTVGLSIVNSASVTATNVIVPVPDPEVCPDGSTPVGGVCPDPGIPGPDPDAGGVFLPIVIKNN